MVLLGPAARADRRLENLKEDLVSFSLWGFPEVSFVTIATSKDDTVRKLPEGETG